MAFPQNLRTMALLWCDRHCCVCKKACGVNIEVHHIIPSEDGGDDELGNAIPLCLDCHSEVVRYNANHPKGNRYRPEELKARREQVYEEFTRGLVPPVHYEITQALPNGGSLHLPDVGFILSHWGDSQPVTVKVMVEVIRKGGQPIGLEGYYSGEEVWHLNPRFSIFGHFNVPPEVQQQNEELRLRLNVTIIDQYQRPHNHLPVAYVYIGKTNSWYLEP